MSCFISLVFCSFIRYIFDLHNIWPDTLYDPSVSLLTRVWQYLVLRPPEVQGRSSRSSQSSASHLVVVTRNWNSILNLSCSWKFSDGEGGLNFASHFARSSRDQTLNGALAPFLGRNMFLQKDQIYRSLHFCCDLHLWNSFLLVEIRLGCRSCLHPWLPRPMSPQILSGATLRSKVQIALGVCVIYLVL